MNTRPEHPSVSGCETPRDQFESVLLSNIREALVAWDTVGNIIYWNPAAYLLFGWTQKEQLGQPVRQVYFPIFSPKVIEPRPENTAGMDVERLCRTKSGREVWVSGRTTALREPWGARRIIGFMDLCRDVSELVQMLDRLQSMYLQLAEHRRLVTLGQLAASIGHQVSNPLTTIIAEAQLAVSHWDEKLPVIDALKAIEEAGWRAQQVVNTLMQFSEPNDDAQEPVSLRDTLERATVLVGATLAMDNVQLRVECPPDIHPIRANPTRIVNLWVNLLLSTRAFLNKDSENHVIVHVQEIPGSVIVEMLQTGMNALPSNVDALLEPSLNPCGYGTGMELAVCREIVRQNRGTISVHGAGTGILIRIELPLED